MTIKEDEQFGATKMSRRASLDTIAASCCLGTDHVCKGLGGGSALVSAAPKARAAIMPMLGIVFAALLA